MNVVADPLFRASFLPGGMFSNGHSSSKSMLSNMRSPLVPGVEVVKSALTFHLT